MSIVKSRLSAQNETLRNRCVVKPYEDESEGLSSPVPASPSPASPSPASPPPASPVPIPPRSASTVPNPRKRNQQPISSNEKETYFSIRGRCQPVTCVDPRVPQWDRVFVETQASRIVMMTNGPKAFHLNSLLRYIRNNIHQDIEAELHVHSFDRFHYPVVLRSKPPARDHPESAQDDAEEYILPEAASRLAHKFRVGVIIDEMRQLKYEPSSYSCHQCNLDIDTTTNTDKVKTHTCFAASIQPPLGCVVYRRTLEHNDEVEEHWTGCVRPYIQAQRVRSRPLLQAIYVGNTWDFGVQPVKGLKPPNAEQLASVFDSIMLLYSHNVTSQANSDRYLIHVKDRESIGAQGFLALINNISTVRPSLDHPKDLSIHRVSNQRDDGDNNNY